MQMEMSLVVMMVMMMKMMMMTQVVERVAAHHAFLRQQSNVLPNLRCFSFHSICRGRVTLLTLHCFNTLQH